MSDSPAVLIVGAGPAGLTCALTLLKNNIHVRIIEQCSTNHVGTRGAGIMPRSLELFQTLGVLPELQRLRGLEAPLMQLYQNEKVTQLPPLMEKMDLTPSIPFNAMWFVSQADLEETLRNELRKYGCKVELGVELVGFKQDSDGVTASLSRGKDGLEVCKVGYLVGADGAKSTTRKLLGLHFSGEAKDEKGMLVGNVVIDNLSTEIWHLWKPSPDILISLRPYNKELRKFVITATGPLPEVAEQGATPANFKELFQRYTKCEGAEFREFEWLSYFKPKTLMVNEMSKGRVFLVGDAAHVHPPHGGQGLNTSVQDSFNLAWKLALVCRRLSPAELLDSYNAERLPVITEMLKQVIGLYNKSDSDTSAERAQHARGKQLFMLGINYRWSSIILPANGGSETKNRIEKLTERAYVGWDDDVQQQPGDRAPECPTLILNEELTSLFKLLTPAKHTVLVFPGGNVGGDPAAQNNNYGLVESVLGGLYSDFKEVMDVFVVVPENVRLSSSVFQTLVDASGHARTAYRATDGRQMVVIIRPDGIIGAMGETNETIKNYASLVFSKSQ